MKQTGATICRLLSAFAVAVLLLISVRAPGLRLHTSG